MKSCRSTWGTLGSLLGLLVATAVAADAPKLSFSFTRETIPGAVQTIPYGLNNAGVSVGTYQDKKMVYHGYILQGKKVITLDPAKSTFSLATGINPNGSTVVGFYRTSNGNGVAFLYKSGKFTDIRGPIGAVAAFASSINDRGDVVGYFADVAQIVHGFLLQGEKYTVLNVPGAGITYAAGINNGGKIVLYWAASRMAPAQTSLFDGKTYKTINVPKALGSYATGINSAGDVTYQWVGDSGAFHGALLHAGKFYTFNYPKAAQTWGGGVNDKNVIAGQFQHTSDGPVQGFRATYR